MQKRNCWSQFCENLLYLNGQLYCVIQIISLQPSFQKKALTISGQKAHSLSMASFIDQIILQWFAFKKESISNLMNLLFNANLNKYSNFTEYSCLFFFFCHWSFHISLSGSLIPWAGQKHPWSEVVSLAWASFEGFLKACSPSCVESGWCSLDIVLFKPYKDII